MMTENINNTMNPLDAGLGSQLELDAQPAASVQEEVGMQNESSPQNAEQVFMRSVQEVQVLKLDLGTQVQGLEQWLADLLSRLETPLVCSPLLVSESSLAQSLAALQEQKQGYPQQWDAQWEELKPALNMADAFADKLMFLVFGKFNAGKSSFCNLLVDRFVAQGLPAEYFVLEAGQIQSTTGPFKEGTTETTAHIQGAILANRLVFIDTPGLHSVTQENADLTQRFLDSADAVLWLSSSTSPGQVQELEELALEIRRRKPLMPIITRSDFLDEDIVDNEIVNVLCNKSVDNRTLQEEDVLSRAQDKLVQLGLDAGLIKSPLSVSAYAARAYGLTEQALEEAGIYRFYQTVTQMISPLLDYKARKPFAMYLHHLEENVVRDVLYSCETLQAYQGTIVAERMGLKVMLENLAESIWREIVSYILRLLDEYFAAVEGAGANAEEFVSAESVVSASGNTGEGAGASVRGHTGADLSAQAVATLEQGLISAMAQEYQTQLEQALSTQYVLPSQLVTAAEFKAPQIEQYFSEHAQLRADDFEKIYLSLESLSAKQIKENIHQVQQTIDAELEQTQLAVEELQVQLQEQVRELAQT